MATEVIDSNIQTSRFGDLEIDERLVYEFRDGIPGFEHLTKFVVVTLDEQDGISYLQSVEQGDVSFIIVNPFEFFSNYSFDLPEQAIKELEIQGEEDVAVWTIVTVRDELEKATVNLIAPVVLNVRARLGKQVILVNRHYQTRHSLFQPLEGV